MQKQEHSEQASLAKQQIMDKIAAVKQAAKVSLPGDPGDAPSEWPHFDDREELVLKGAVFRAVGFREEDKVLELKYLRPSMVLENNVRERQEQRKRRRKSGQTKKKRRKTK